jgi:hypothetical protein
MTTTIGDVNNILQLYTVDDVGLMANYLLVLFQIERNDSSQDKKKKKTDESSQSRRRAMKLFFFIISLTQ